MELVMNVLRHLLTVATYSWNCPRCSMAWTVFQYAGESSADAMQAMDEVKQRHERERHSA
jgi:hypothetical protein